MKKSAADIAKEQFASIMQNNLTAIPKPESVKASEPQTRQGNERKPKTMSADPAVGHKSTLITLYPRDFEQIQEIIKFLVNNGRRGNASQAVRLALRSVALTDSLLAYDDEMKADNLRRKPTDK